MRRLAASVPGHAGIAVVLGAAVLAGTRIDAEDTSQKPVAAMSLEELANLEVTSVSKKPELLMEAVAAVYVITQEDIRRSGVSTLVEALRLAPGVEVARINSSQWAVGIRGFTSRFSRAVLVLIDGRSVYTPLFAGVYWEAQDTLLEDVERIEVIRGPGGTLWGANAVNGVINIITKNSRETQGGLVSAGGGSEDRFLGGARFGGMLDDKTAYRVYGKYSDRSSEFHSDGKDFDAWHLAQGGFRVDSALSSRDAITLQGDVYTSRDGQRATPSFYTTPFIRTVDEDANLSGGNVLGRWRRSGSDGSELVLQGYWDRTYHRETIFRETRDTIDFDSQYRLRLFASQEVTVGLGFRWSASDTESIPTVVISPARRTDQLYSAFLQDEIPLLENRLRLTLGTKLEHNVFTGFELQPTARLLWTPAEGHDAWAAVSRAVRTPSRLEFDVSRSTALGPTTPAFLRLTGDGDFVSEKVIAYEVGYRVRLGKTTVVDVTAFYNDLSDLTSGDADGPFFIEGQGASAHLVAPFAFRNGIEGRSRGVEVSVDTGITNWLTVRANYSYLALDFKDKPGSADTTSVASFEGSSPRHKATLAASLNLPRGFELNGVLRFTDRLPAQGVGSILDADLQVAWRTGPLELSLSGQGLLRPRQLFFAGGESGNVEIERAVFGKVTWKF